MDEIVGNLIDLCAIIMLLLSLLAMAAATMGQLLKAFALQSLFLTILALIMAFSEGEGELLIMACITFGVKVVLIPWFLRYTTDHIKTGRGVDSSIGIPSSLILCAVLIMVAYFVTAPILDSFDTLTRNCLAISLSIVFIGLFMMVTRKRAMTEAIGLLIMENGLFLGILSISHGMPLLIELGIFFDVLMISVIIGIFAFRISRTFNSLDTSFMRRLKD